MKLTIIYLVLTWIALKSHEIRMQRPSVTHDNVDKATRRVDTIAISPQKRTHRDVSIGGAHAIANVDSRIKVIDADVLRDYRPRPRENRRANTSWTRNRFRARFAATTARPELNSDQIVNAIASAARARARARALRH